MQVASLYEVATSQPIVAKKKSAPQGHESGFTLIELSIVLIIIALLAAGIMGGQVLIRQAELKSVLTDVTEYTQSVNAFQLQYDGLPGDHEDMHSYFDDGANGVCGTAAQCNGDADGEIDLGGVTTDNEAYRAWQHLSLANIVPGSFTGIGNDSSISGATQNVAASSVQGGGFSIFYSGDNGNASSATNNRVVFGAPGTGIPTRGAVLTSNDARSIDLKADDGVPGDGTVGSFNGASASGNCIDSATAYNLDNTGIACGMWFDLEQ